MKRDQIVSIRFSEDEKKLLKRIGEHMGMYEGPLVRMLALTKAREWEAELDKIAS